MGENDLNVSFTPGGSICQRHKNIKHNKHFALRDNNSESNNLLFLKNIPLTH